MVIMRKLFKSDKFRFRYNIVKTGMFVAIPVLLLCLPADFFDYGQSISLFELAGVEDYHSKGMTRAIMHLIHFDFEVAWQYNKLSFIVLPLMTWVWGKSFLKNYQRTRKMYLHNKTAL